MEIVIPSKIDEYNLVLRDADLKKEFDQLMDNKLFKGMLAYPFSWMELSDLKSGSKGKLSKVKGRLASLMNMTNEEFEETHSERKYMSFDEDAFKKYQRSFLKQITNTPIPLIIKHLKQAGYLEGNLFSGGMTNHMKEMNFTLGNIDSKTKLKKLMGARVEKGKGFQEGTAYEGPLIAAFDEEKSILDNSIADYTKVTGQNITFDMSKYLNEIFKEEGFGEFLTEEKRKNFKWEVGEPRREANFKKVVPAFKFIKRKDGRYSLEGLFKTRIYDDLDDAWEGFHTHINLNELEKHLDETLTTQKPSSISDIFYDILTPIDRKIDVGRLDIFVEKLTKTVEGEKVPMDKDGFINWARAKAGMRTFSNKNMEKLRNVLFVYFNYFSENKKEVEDWFEEGVKSDVVSDIQSLESKLEKVKSIKYGEDKALIFSDLTSKDMYDLWKGEKIDSADDVDLDLMDEVANALMNNILERKGVYHQNVTASKDGDNYPISQGNIVFGHMVKLNVEFTAAHYIDVKTHKLWFEEYGIDNTGSKKLRELTLTGKKHKDIRPAAKEGEETSSKDYQKLLDLDMGFNRLKAMVN
jgi:hypothetical protein